MPTECSKEMQTSKHKENNLFLSSFQCLLCSWWLEQEIIGLLNQSRFRLVTREEPCNRKDYGSLEEIAKGALLMHMAIIRHVSDDNALARGESCLGAGDCPGQSPDLLSSWPFSYFCERNMNWKIIGVED